MILYRSVGLQELGLIYDSGMKSFPASMPQQPIFYPVLQLEYARQVASDWNARNGQFGGYVTQFKMEDQYLELFEEHTVGGSQYQEFWIPAAELDTFNEHIQGRIKVVEGHFADEFQGFVPNKFGLQGKKVVEQFTFLANSYIYKRVDFYLEIRRNHKAIFLNYPFWQKHDFENQSLKEKILQAIKEAWFTSYPEIPLPGPAAVEITPAKSTDLTSLDERVPEDAASSDEVDTNAWESADEGEIPSVEAVIPFSFEKPVDEKIESVNKPDPQASANSVHRDDTPVANAGLHFLKGLELGSSGQYQEALDELFKAVVADPKHVVAHTSLGVVFRRLGEDDRAASSYETALKIDPIYAEAHYFRANVLYAQGNVREAIAGYTIAIGLKPELIDAHETTTPPDRLTDYNRAPAEMYWMAKPAHRILELNKLLEADRGQAGLLKERAAQYYRLRNYVQAIADYSSSLESGPPDAKVFHLRGVAYEQIGQFDRAVEDYQRAITLDPHLSDAYINRGIAFGKMRNFRQSIASFGESIRLAPRNPDGYFNRGMSYFQQGDMESAIDDFSIVIRLAPQDEAAYYWRGISHEEAGRRREASADYKQFLAVSQDVNARGEIEKKLQQWSVSKSTAVQAQSQKTDPALPGKPADVRDLYSLIAALGERAHDAVWFCRGVECYGDNAEELYAFSDQDKPIDGRHLLTIASGIRQTIAGDFWAFDPDASSHWIFIRAWEGSGLYIEIDAPEIKELLRSHFQRIEEVEGASHPYESLFIATH